MNRILVVDDSERDRRLLQMLLTKHGYDVTLAADGAEALDRARSSPPDLVISDIIMPGMDGYALCRQWKGDKELSAIPFVFYTASCIAPKDEELALNMGAERFIVKPQKEQSFLDMVGEVLGEHGAGRRAPAHEPMQEERVYLREYNEALIRKLEDDLVDIQSARASLDREAAGRGKAEEALRGSEETLKDVIFNMADRVWELDEKCVYTYSSKNHQGGPELFHDSPIGKTPFDFMPPDEAKRVAAIFAEISANKAPIKNLESWTVGRNGEHLCLLTNGVPILDAGGNLKGYRGVDKDITAHKRAEQTVLASETRYRRLFESAKDGILILDAETGAIVDVNPYLIGLLGQDRETFLDKKLWELGPFKDFVASKAAFAVLQEKEYIRYEFLPLERKDGRLVEVEFVSNVYLVDGAKVIQCNIRDITARRNAEKKARAGEAFLDCVINAMESPFFVKDENRNFVLVNGAFGEMIGCPKEWLLGGNDDGMLPEEQVAVFRKVDAAVLATGEGNINEEFLTDASTGKLRSVVTHKSRYIDAEGRRFIIGMIHDITQRRQAEEAHARLAMAVEQSAEAVIICDTGAAIVYVNTAFERTSGYASGEVVGLNPRILKSGRQDTEFYRQMWATLSAGQVWSGHMINRRKDGALFEEEAIISPMRDAAGVIINYIAVKRDVTHEVELEAQLRQAQKMEAVGQLAGGVAHDFNNILQAMTGYCSMLLEVLPEQDETHEYAEEILKGADRAATLTRQMLAFSRRQVLEMEDMELSDVVRGLMKMIQRIIGESIVVKTIEGGGGFVRADRGQMEQVLLNLCINARDAMPEGGTLVIKTENVEIDSEYCACHAWAIPGRYVLLSVTDTGCGMDADVQSHIFEPFFTTKEVGRGTGMGLATVYGIVRQHQGMIQVYSEAGVGTTFKVYLPRVKHTAAPVAAKAVERARGGTETILLAEDEEALRKLATRILEGAGYAVLSASDGQEALDVFEAHTGEIALCLLDVVMPKMGGKAVHDALSRKHPHLRFLFSSGYSMDAIHKGFVLNEGIELIQKPYAPNVLLHKIREILDGANGKAPQ